MLTQPFPHNCAGEGAAQEQHQPPTAVDRSPGQEHQPREANFRKAPASRKYHVVTSLGEGIYQQWQMRVHYYW